MAQKVFGKEARLWVKEYREERGEAEMSFGAYITLFVVAVVVGLAGFGGIASLTYDVAFTGKVLAAWVVAVVVLGLIVAPMLIVAGEREDNPAYVCVAYAMLVVLFGFAFGPIAKMVGMKALANAVIATIAITAAFGIMGVLFQAVFVRMAGVLFAALVGLILVEGGALFALLGFGADVKGIFAVTDWVAIGTFSLFIGYDMAMTMQMKPNATNALLGATNMFMNIVNLLLRLVEHAPDVVSVVVENAGDAL